MAPEIIHQPRLLTTGVSWPSHFRCKRGDGSWCDVAEPKLTPSSLVIMVHRAIVQGLGYCVRVYKTRWLARFARRERIGDDSLKEAIERAERGLIDADLGGGIIKQRVARPGQGRSGGWRMLIAYRAGDRAVFSLRLRQARAGEHRAGRAADAARDRGGMAGSGRRTHRTSH